MTCGIRPLPLPALSVRRRRSTLFARQSKADELCPQWQFPGRGHSVSPSDRPRPAGFRVPPGPARSPLFLRVQGWARSARILTGAHEREARSGAARFRCGPCPHPLQPSTRCAPRGNPHLAEQTAHQVQVIDARKGDQWPGVTNYWSSHGDRSVVSRSVVSSLRTSSIPSSPRYRTRSESVM